MSATKPTNPKDAIGSGKLPLHLWPEIASVLGCLGLLDGMLKYGRANWRAAGVRASIYVDALRRHMSRWFEGEDLDLCPDCGRAHTGDADSAQGCLGPGGSGLPHLAHALACLAIIVDAEATGRLNDDRQYAGEGFANELARLTPHVARLQQLHSARAPKHWTVADGARIEPVVPPTSSQGNQTDESTRAPHPLPPGATPPNAR